MGIERVAWTRHLGPMSLTLTVILLAVALLLMGFSGWRGAQPPDVARGARMVPWRFVMILSAAFGMLLLIHLATLFGLRPAT